MSPFSLSSVNVVVDTSPGSHAAALTRLEIHRQTLERNGVPPISDLGTLALSGSVLATPGVIHAPVMAPQPPVLLPQPSLTPAPLTIPGRRTTGLTPVPLPIGDDPETVPVPVSLRRRGNRLEPGFAQASRPAGAMFVDWSAAAQPAGSPSSTAASMTAASPSAAALISLDVAYFVGQTVTLADNTVIVLKWPHQYLTFIAEDLRIGANVVFTFEHPPATASPESWPPGNRPPTPPTPLPRPDLWNGAPGARGVDGRHGGAGFAGVDAPFLELWALKMTGSPRFDLRGQDGTPGGRGQDGGAGGRGADGWPEQYDWLGFCARGAGAGGDGGGGGNGGNAGPGGPGGHGGRLTVYAPASVLTAYAAGGFSISTDGGDGGIPGGPGAPGPGGPGGLLGPRPKNCAMSSGDRHDGTPGPIGNQGGSAWPGTKGAFFNDATKFIAITENDFRQNLTKPALIKATPQVGVAGAEVTLSTLRLQNTDVLLIDDVVVPMTVIADTLASFVVPADALGGRRTLRVRQSDGTLSNPMTFYVMPQVSFVGDGGRQKPGTIVTVSGSGFEPGARVIVTAEEMTEVAFVNGRAMTFRLHRPTGTKDNAAGEIGYLKVILADGQASNEVEFLIDTLNVIVLGDSVAWGQGLPDQQKYHTKVAHALEAAGGGIKAYTTQLAHSGATIGVGDNTNLPAIPGEVPTSYPTAMQQLGMVTTDSATVDLVLVTAGLNDVNFRNVISPVKKPADFAGGVRQHCHRDLRTLLIATANKFPNATIVATNYYQIVSDNSQSSGLTAFIVAAGVIVGGPVGGTLGAGAISQMVTNARAFHEMSTTAIRSAVDDTNDQLSNPRVLFADPGFKPENSVYASDPWLYAVNPDLSPQDPFTAGGRALVCAMNKKRSDEFTCVRASLGHPNERGAQAYADAILAALARGTTDAETSLPPFPPGFLFGVATAGMQNEGGITNNDWAEFAKDPTCQKWVKIITGKEGGHAADLRPPGDAVRHSDPAVLAADLDRASGLGINAYRFSVEWSRLLPKRPNHAGDLTAADFNAAALSYYDKVLDLLAERAMTPVLTLNHLTLPLWALNPPKTRVFGAPSFAGIDPPDANDPDFTASMRGWESPGVVDEYVRLTKFLANRWSSKVRWWVTVNEPVGSGIAAGYFAGVWSPGFVADGARGKKAYFNMIKAHLRAYETIKAANANAQVGFAHAMMFAKTTYEFADDLANDQDAARNQFDYFYNWHMLNAVIDGQLDQNIERRPGDRRVVSGAALANWAGLNAGPWASHCDFVGLNYYRSVYVFGFEAIAKPIAPLYSGGRFRNNLNAPASEQTQVHQLTTPMGWEIYPAGFSAMMRSVHTRYGTPVMVTENGIAQTEDTTRGAFIAGHLSELLAAVRDGVNVTGYMYWTLVDNWEWHEGYWPNARFGLFTVDRAAAGQPRYLTDGAMAYSYAIKTGSVRGIRDRFGLITPGGDVVRAPRTSMAYLVGTADAGVLQLSLRANADGRVMGLMSGSPGARLLPVSGTFDPATGILKLLQPASRGVRAATLVVQTSGGLSFTGTLTRGGQAPVPVTLRQDPLVGQWAGTGPVQRLQVSRVPSGVNTYVGSWMGDDLPRGWKPMTVEPGTSNFTFRFNPGRAVVTLAGASLNGQLAGLGLVPAPQPWSATRRLDALGLIHP